jgi:hypothetical protein
MFLWLFVKPRGKQRLFFVEEFLERENPLKGRLCVRISDRGSNTVVPSLHKVSEGKNRTDANLFCLDFCSQTSCSFLVVLVTTLTRCHCWSADTRTKKKNPTKNQHSHAQAPRLSPSMLLTEHVSYSHSSTHTAHTYFHARKQGEGTKKSNQKQFKTAAQLRLSTALTTCRDG